MDSDGGGLTISAPDQALLEQLTKAENDLAEARSQTQVLHGHNPPKPTQPLLRREQLATVDLTLSLNKQRLTSANEQRELNNEFLKQPELIKQFNELQGQPNIAEANLEG